jgi:hypothetical protein
VKGMPLRTLLVVSPMTILPMGFLGGGVVDMVVWLSEVRRGGLLWWSRVITWRCSGDGDGGDLVVDGWHRRRDRNRMERDGELF